MSKTVEFYYDYGSPASYLAWTQLEKLAERTGATIVWKPALLGGIFKETQNRPPISVPAKGAWMVKDLARFAQRYDVPMQMNPKFPINTIYLMRGALVAQRDGYLDTYNRAIFNGMWVDAEDVGDMTVVARLLTAAGLDPETFGAAIQAPEIKKELFARNDEAVAKGIFGMPSFVIDGELHWGQDRLDFVEEALMR